MDHGGHTGHEMPMAKCSMNMLWNWEVEDTCVIFRSWHISSSSTMLLSCIAVALIAFVYELLQSRVRAYDRRIATALVLSHPGVIGGGSGRSSPEPGGGATTTFPTGMAIGLPNSVRLVRASSYALSTAVSFFLMLVFMTYNGYLIAAVIVGAGIGHWSYNREMDPLAVLGGSASGKPLACC